ncbi:Protocadherin Fat 4 [Eumeta japonica]|uniref:Protocadherin Fat 4 n=1 Tax=Eumeta variegata TaxID=151549 RepID=A0A4C1X5M1_EUMVA|nr:Protocadherin Fat 4 [Eumeta japonica]
MALWRRKRSGTYAGRSHAAEVHVIVKEVEEQYESGENVVKSGEKWSVNAHHKSHVSQHFATSKCPPRPSARPLRPHSHGGVFETMSAGATAPTPASAGVGCPGPIQDSRCYLMNGGAVESFFISEDTPVGAIIGTLSVNGDPRGAEGDISLRVQERDAALAIAPGTKNLTLVRALDREERAGPASLYVNVRCDRRRTTDPASIETSSSNEPYEFLTHFIIPVSVRVWDVNDNAPAWEGAPYRVRLSELTAVGSRVQAGARAADADQPGPHATVHYSVLPGPFSDYLGFANELDSVLVVRRPLDYETLGNFTVTLRAQDQGEPPLYADAPLHVELLDADDQNPKFDHDHYSALLPDDAIEGTELVVLPGPIFAADQDVGINAPLFYAATGDNRELLRVDKDSGRVAATAGLLRPSLHFPLTFVIKATQYDNADRYALATLTVSKREAGGPGGVSAGIRDASVPGADDAQPVRFSRRSFMAAVPEDLPVGSVLTQLATNRGSGNMAQRSGLQFYVSDRAFLEKFAINAAGEVVLRRALDHETDPAYHYQVMVTDGAANDTASLNITVLNVNDWEPRFRYPQYEFRLEAPDDDAGRDDGLLPVGKLDVFDGDRGDRVTLSLHGPDANLFYLNDSGELFVRREALAALNSSAVHVLATAQDSGRPPRKSSVPVVVHIGESLRGAAAGARGGVLLALFAAALALLALLVLLLLAYIYRAKRSKSPGNDKTNTGFVQNEKMAHGGAGRGSGGAGAARAPALGASPLGGSGSLLSVSAGASTILANSSSSLDLRDPMPGESTASGRNAQGQEKARKAAGMFHLAVRHKKSGVES